jgi:hypothetical protein
MDNTVDITLKLRVAVPRNRNLLNQTIKNGKAIMAKYAKKAVQTLTIDELSGAIRGYDIQI